MNWFWLILLGAGVIALIIFMIRQNMKDEKKFTNQIMRNYRKTKDEENDTPAEDVPK